MKIPKNIATYCPKCKTPPKEERRLWWTEVPRTTENSEDHKKANSKIAVQEM